MATRSSRRRLHRRVLAFARRVVGSVRTGFGLSRSVFLAMLLVAAVAFSVAALAIVTERARTLEDGRVTAARLSQLLDDPALRARLGENGRQLVEARFALERQAEQLANVLRDVSR